MVERVRTPSKADFGSAYFHGVASNYRGYLRASKLTWVVPYLWMFRQLERRYGPFHAHLDIGCAFGFFLAFAHQPARRSAGVDLSPHAIAQARSLFPHLAFSEGDITAVPFPDTTFDIITSFHTLEHIPNVSAGVQELSRVLASGGTLFCIMPYNGIFRRFFGWNDRDRTHVSVLAFAEWRAQFTHASLQIVHAWRYPTVWGGNILLVARKKN